jgi:hypothetical protein
MGYQVFICYRWADTAGVAGRLYDVLAKQYGDDNVFFDVERQGGAERLDELVFDAVRDSGVVLMLIGQRWFTADQTEQPRLLRDDDVVRLEIETALENAVPVIPVLVEGGNIPSPTELPSTIRPITALARYELNNRFWKAGLDKLLPAIEVAFLSRSHVAILERGKAAWDRWRSENPSVRPRLVNAALREHALEGFNLSDCDLMAGDFRACNLSGCSLNGADLTDANLAHAKLVETDLTRASLKNANALAADFTRARIDEADLTNANFNDAEFGESILSGCRVWGVSVWGARFTQSVQRNLKIGRDDAVTVTVDDMSFASLFSLVQDSRQFRSLLDAFTQKFVLVLGRFVPEQMEVMTAIEGRLRELGFVPIKFDFERPTTRDLSEVLKSFAGLSRFIVAEISSPRSIPLELQAVVPEYQIPLVPLLREGEVPFAMFTDLVSKFDWVLDTLRYSSVEGLMHSFDTAVVRAALEKADQLQRRRAARVLHREVDDFLS